MKVQLQIETDLSVEQIAQAFCSLDDDSQARFFVECAKIAHAWPRGGSSYGADWQWHAIGRHLRTCECATEEGRDMVRAIAGGLTP